jgi:hypothetical protein
VLSPRVSVGQPLGASEATAAPVAGSQLIEAIDQFEYALERRANSDTAENAALLNTAESRLKGRVEAFIKELETIGSARVRSLRQHADVLRAVCY